jgi:TetR/AcrR family transcriptional regulator
MDLRPRMPATDRRQQLLEAALEVFSRRGFEGATTKEIAAAADVTEAVIFRHFPTKQALYAAVLEYHQQSCHFNDWLAEAKACMERCDDEGLFRTIAATVIETYRRDPRGHRVVLFAALEGHEQALAHYRALSIPIFELLNEYILRRQQEGALVPVSSGAILTAIAGMATHYAMLTQMFGFECDTSDEAIVETFTRILMNGIRSGPQHS